MPVSQGAGRGGEKQLLEDGRLAWAPDAGPEHVSAAPGVMLASLPPG